MRNINIGDEVCVIEVWKDDPTGPLAPDQTTADCRMYGVCRGFEDDVVRNCKSVVVTPEMDDDIESGLLFPSLIVAGMKEGDSIVMHVDDAKELFPVTGLTQSAIELLNDKTEAPFAIDQTDGHGGDIETNPLFQK